MREGISKGLNVVQLYGRFLLGIQISLYNLENILHTGYSGYLLHLDLGDFHAVSTFMHWILFSI